MTVKGFSGGSGFPGSLDGKGSPVVQETQVQALDAEDPLE